jgi:hypothetical protein
MSPKTEFTRAELEDAHIHSSCNKNEIIASDFCACFYCKRVYEPSQIKEWLFESRGELATKEDKYTAICPYCGIDSVIGSVSKYDLSKEFIEAMNNMWFSISANENGKMENQ